MPGPCSAPNGNYSITTMKRDKNQMVKSGKTAKKRGHDVSYKPKNTGARRREQEQE